MSAFNLSALAVRERAVTLFLLVAISIAGMVAFLVLGRAEDPSFTIKQMTVVTAWPGATACLLYTSPSPRDRQKSRMPSSA